MGKILDEIKTATGEAIVKNQDAAKVNMPNILNKIKAAAVRAESECRISTTEMNEWDKSLLVSEGFSVSLVDRERNAYDDISQYLPNQKTRKEWLIRW